MQSDMEKKESFSVSLPPAVRREMAAHLSLTLIAKNAATDLAGCLSSATGVVDEMVVADTGSTDQTRQLAAGHGARVVDFVWCDSFAARHAPAEAV
jgi:hypothetical protein